MLRCVQHLEGLGRGVQPAQEAVAAEMETVLYAQMLALFAPQTVRGASHVAPLLATLCSRQPALRRAAADTLRHLAERSALRSCSCCWSQCEGACAPALVAGRTVQGFRSRHVLPGE